MYLPTVSVLLPNGVVRLQIYPTHPVQGHNVKVPHRTVILRRVTRRHHDPALRQLVTAEGLALQKLQHGRCQRLGDAVDLVQEQDAGFQPGALHGLVDAGDDLAHGVLGQLVLLAIEHAGLDAGQADGALAGVVGHGVGHDADAALLGGLVGDGGLADARRAHEQQGTLCHLRDGQVPEGVPSKVRLDGLF